MKIWYFINDNSFEYIVAFGNTPEEAFERFMKSRTELITTSGMDADINHWKVEEFTPERYDGVLVFF